MQADFWHERWKTNAIGFHLEAVNPLLVAFIDTLNLTPNQRIFLPLCGKTHDIAWLLAQGYRVVGNELSKVAVTQLFDELGVEPNISKHGRLRLYSAKNLAIWLGDFFDLTASLLGKVDAVYDRAALVALPLDMRQEYTGHLRIISQTAPQLLICSYYAQAQRDGPPFSISDEEVSAHYSLHYRIKNLYKEPRDDDSGATKNVWLLRKKAD